MYLTNQVYRHLDIKCTLYECTKVRNLHYPIFESLVVSVTYYMIKNILESLTLKDMKIFLGYSLNNRAYHVYNLADKTVKESVDVVVDDTSCSRH